jgi:uncharacterized Tic20 family protein
MTAATPAPAAPLSEAEDKQYAGLAHLLGILGIIPSLIIYLVFKDRGAKTNVEGKEALNFQITMLGLEIIGYILVVILIGFLIIPAVYVVRIIFSIIGFMKVNEGGSYRYPFAIRLIK